MALLLSFLFSLKFYFWEPNGFTKTSLVYYLKVDDDIKTFPIFSPQEDARFHVMTDDGVKPSITEVTYHTSLKLTDILLAFKKLDFACNQDIDSTYICTKTDVEKRIVSVEIIKDTSLKVVMAFVGF